MARGISIGIAADTRDWITGLQKGSVELENMQDSIEQVTEASVDGGDKIEETFKEQQEQTEKLKAAHRELAQAIRDSSAKSNRQLRKDSKDTADDLTADFKKIGNEAGQNLSQAVKSFDGDLSKLGDTAQSTLGGLLTKLHPVGAAIGAIGAVGVGLLISQLEEVEKQQEAVRSKASELTKELMTAGQDGEVSFDYVIAQLQELATATEENAINLGTIKQLSVDIGEDYGRLALSYAGQTDAVAGQITAIEDLLEAERKRALWLNAEGRDEKGVFERQEHIGQLEKHREELQKIADAAAQAQEAEQLWLDMGGQSLETRLALLNSVNQEYDRAAGAVGDFVDKETGVFDTAAYIKSMQEREKALREYQEALATADLSDDAKEFLASQGADAAAQFLKGYQSSNDSQKAELNRIWSEAGRENSGSYEEALDKFLPEKVDGPEIELQTPDPKPLIDNLQRQLNNQTLTLPLQLTLKEGERAW